MRTQQLSIPYLSITTTNILVSIPYNGLSGDTEWLRESQSTSPYSTADPRRPYGSVSSSCNLHRPSYASD